MGTNTFDQLKYFTSSSGAYWWIVWVWLCACSEWIVCLAKFSHHQVSNRANWYQKSNRIRSSSSLSHSLPCPFKHDTSIGFQENVDSACEGNRIIACLVRHARLRDQFKTPAGRKSVDCSNFTSLMQSGDFEKKKKASLNKCCEAQQVLKNV